MLAALQVEGLDGDALKKVCEDLAGALADLLNSSKPENWDSRYWTLRALFNTNYVMHIK